MKTIRELINLIESAQNPEQQYQIYFVIPEHDDYDDRHEPTETTIVTASSANEAGKKFRAEVPEAYIKQIVPLNYNKGVAEGSEHNVGDTVNYSTKVPGFNKSAQGGQGKITKKTATHYTVNGKEMPHSHIKSRAQGVAEGSAELLKQEMPLVRHIERELAQHGYEKGTPEYNQMFKHAIAMYRKFGNVDAIKQGVAEALSKTDLLKQVSAELNNPEFRKKPADPTKSFTKGDHWQGAKPGDYGYTGYQGHGMPTDRAERARIRADKKKQQDK